LDKFGANHPKDNIEETPRLKEILENYTTIESEGKIKKFLIRKNLYERLTSS
jgi:hypothetical protein